MQKWPYETHPFYADEIKKAEADEFWEIFRLGLEKMSTADKLAHLAAYRYNRHNKLAELARIHQVQIDTYINKLKAEGLLDENLNVVR